MNRKASNTERNAGPDYPGIPAAADPGRFLAYENIPDPISFEDARTIPMQPANSNDIANREDHDPEPGRA